MGRYAVWTSDVNVNDQPDLTEAFFVRRERAPHDPMLRVGRRFAGANVWPDDLPRFRETVLTYVDTVDTLAHRFLPVCATALELPPDCFDAAFAESQFTFRALVVRRELRRARAERGDVSGYSITRSARASSGAGIGRPSACAVLRLIASSNFVGCSIGRSAGLTPFTTLWTYVAARRNRSS